MTNVELAQRVGISAPPCLRRVRALEEAGYIRGYHAELNPQQLGYGVTVFAMVGLNRDRKSTRLTPVTNAHLVCRILLEKKKKTSQITKHLNSQQSINQL